MPPRDPRLCPALERALPASYGPEPVRVLAWPEIRLVLFGDGQWHPVSVRSWTADTRGRTVMGIEWHAGGDTWGESYVYEAGKVKEPGAR